MPTSDEILLNAEQRRYRRLEVSLPVWIITESELNAGGNWSLGYTRDVSLGGAKIIAQRGQEEKWQAACEADANCVVRFGDGERHDEEFINGNIKRAAFDVEKNQFWLGLEYSPGADSAKKEALRLGLKTMHSRRRWQGAFGLTLALVAVAIFSILQLRGQVRARETRIATLQKNIQTERQLLSGVLEPGLVSTRAQGIDAAFQSRQINKRIHELQANMARLSNPKNAEAGQTQRAEQRQRDGLNISAAPATGAQINLGVALPYGYAWPQVTADLEEILGRRIPTVVIFRDWSQPFPIEDCREARLRAKTLQITWEPWKNSDPKSIKLRDIVAGKHDKYIDSWAQAAKSFGNELWMRWGHEFNGNWYAWSVSANGRDPKLYAAAFRHVHSRFVRAGALNVKWIWCLNAESVPNESWNDPLKAYPGDASVDMISIDGYNFGNSLSHSRWQSFTEIFGSPYDRVRSRFKNKPIMIGETGCATTGGDKAEWISAMDKSLRTRFKKVSALVWFEAQKEADWRMSSSPAARQASRKVWSQTYFRRGEP